MSILLGALIFFPDIFVGGGFFIFACQLLARLRRKMPQIFPLCLFAASTVEGFPPSAGYSPPPPPPPTFTPVVLSVELRRTIRLSKLQRGKKTSPWSSPPPGYFCCFYFSTRLGWIGVALTLKIFIKMLLLWSHYLLRRHLCLKKASVTFTPSFLWSKKLFLFPNQ